MLRGSITFSSSLPTWRGVAGRHLAVAHDAVERRAHLGALQLLARRRRRAPWRPRRSLCAVLRRTSASSSACAEVMPGAAQRLHALAAGARPGRGLARRRARLPAADMQASRIEVSSRRTSRSPLLHRLAVLLEHLQHHGRDLGAQVGAALGLDRAGDDGARHQGARAQHQHVLGADQQRRRPPWRRPLHRPASGSRPAAGSPAARPRASIVPFRPLPLKTADGAAHRPGWGRMMPFPGWCPGRRGCLGRGSPHCRKTRPGGRPACDETRRPPMRRRKAALGCGRGRAGRRLHCRPHERLTPGFRRGGRRRGRRRPVLRRRRRPAGPEGAAARPCEPRWPRRCASPAAAAATSPTATSTRARRTSTSSGANPNFCRSALSRYTAADFIGLVQRHGIPFHEKHKGQLFGDRSSDDFIQMLLAECGAGGVTHWQPCAVHAVRWDGAAVRDRHRARARAGAAAGGGDRRAVDPADRRQRLRLPARPAVRPGRRPDPAGPGAAHLRRAKPGRRMRSSPGWRCRCASPPATRARQDASPSTRTCCSRTAGLSRAGRAADLHLLAARHADPHRPAARHRRRRGAGAGQAALAQAGGQRAGRPACPRGWPMPGCAGRRGWSGR